MQWQGLGMIRTRTHGLTERLEFGLLENGSWKGTPVWKNQSVAWDVYQEYLIQKLLPAIKHKWLMNNGRIWLQQDGAKSHIQDDDEEFKEAVDDIGLNLTVYTKSPNSPATNILDLGFSELYSRSMMIALPMKKN